jgi:dehydrogenase/reductase SDR family protein 7B
MSFIKDKVVLITGGSSGIGKACAERFGREGGRICITGRNAENLEAAAEELRDKNIEVMAVQGDVANENDCVRMINETLNKYGRIDVLINNAGISMRAFFKNVEVSVIRQLLKYNGSVVGVSSVAGYQGLPGRSGYSASKFAMEGFLSALRLENHNTGLHVMIVCPGYTESNIRNTALVADGSSQRESPRDEKKMMTSEEVADNIFNGVKNRKKRVVLTAQGKLSYYLSKLIPAFVDRMVIKAIEKEGELPK